MAAIIEPIKAAEVKEVAKVKKVLLYCIYPAMSINVGKTKAYNVEGSDGKWYRETKGTHRVRVFRNHRLWVESHLLDDQIDPITKRVSQMGIRKMGGYGFIFIEALRTPGMPAGAMPLSEMRLKAPKQYEGFFHQVAAKAATDRTVTPLTSDMVRDDIEAITKGTLTAPEGEYDE